jgi:hypothetical protein
MLDARQNSKVSQAVRLLKKLTKKRYRDAYVQSHTRGFLAQQMRAFRGARSQAEMGDILGKPQSVVSRLEDPTYGKWTLTTLLEVAQSLDKAVVVRFVDPETFSEFALDVGDDAQNPTSFNGGSVSRAIAELTLENAPASQPVINFTAFPSHPINAIQIIVSSPNSDNDNIALRFGTSSSKVPLGIAPWVADLNVPAPEKKIYAIQHGNRVA